MLEVWLFWDQPGARSPTNHLERKRERREREQERVWPHGIVARGTRQASEAQPSSVGGEWLSQQWDLRCQVCDPSQAVPAVLQLFEASSLDSRPQREMSNSYPVQILEPQNCWQNIVIVLTLRFFIGYIAIDNWNTNEGTEIQKNHITCPETVRAIVINHIFNCLCSCSFQRTLYNPFPSLANLSVHVGLPCHGGLFPSTLQLIVGELWLA